MVYLFKLWSEVGVVWLEQIGSFFCCGSVQLTSWVLEKINHILDGLLFPMREPPRNLLKIKRKWGLQDTKKYCYTHTHTSMTLKQINVQINLELRAITLVAIMFLWQIPYRQPGILFETWYIVNVCLCVFVFIIY